jgi:hypothetical protein
MNELTPAQLPSGDRVRGCGDWQARWERAAGTVRPGDATTKGTKDKKTGRAIGPAGRPGRGRTPTAAVGSVPGRPTSTYHRPTGGLSPALTDYCPGEPTARSGRGGPTGQPAPSVRRVSEERYPSRFCSGQEGVETEPNDQKSLGRKVGPSTVEVDTVALGRRSRARDTAR